jgi:ketosteroid isomerase-like protein
MRTVKRLWRVYEQEGHDAAVDAMLDVCHDDAEFRLYAAEGRVLHTGDLRAFYRERRAAGKSVEAAPYNVREEGDTVVATGWVRVSRETGSLADAQVRWIYTFRDGLIEKLEYGPLVPSATADSAARAS